MRTPTMIVIGGAVVLGIAWFLLSRTASAPKPAPTPAAVVAAPAPPPAASDTAAHAPEPAPPAPPKAEPPAAEPPPAPSPEPQVEAKDAPATDEVAADEPETPADDDAGTDEEEAPAPIDTSKSADYLADWLTAQEAEGADNPEKGDKALATFDGESADGDPDWSESAEQHIEAVLHEWLANLPDELREHVALIQLECRVTLCQILAADNDAATMDARMTHAQDWAQAVGSLPQQPWWSELGFVDASTSMKIDTTTNYVLYQTYLIRGTPPAE
jgi:hypothetical protein